MKRLFAWLSRRAPSEQPVLTLPQDLIDLLSSEKVARPCKEALEKWALSGALTEPVVEHLGSMARAANWPEDEIEKLIVYADFFSERNQSAYTRILARGYEKGDFDFFVIACISLYLLDKFEDGYALLRERQPSKAEFLENPMFLSFAGYIVQAAGGPIEEAIRYFDIGLECGLSNIAYLTNAYGVYFEAGELEKAEIIRRAVYQAQLNDPQVLFSIACVELARDYYPEGFRLAESRYAHPEAARHMKVDLLKKPRWQGEELRGKQLLVHAEQGLGDTVMCARYIPRLIEAGVEIVVECQDAAVSLLEHNFPGIRVVNVETDAALNLPFDYWIGAMSLPHFLASTAQNIPGYSSYLSVAEDHRDHWRTRVGSAGQALRVGIAWSGNPHHRSDRRRSIGLERIFSYLENSQGVEFFALQTSVPEFLPKNLIVFSDEMVTLSDTAALIMEMDLVITVDTSIVHLAGALGKPTWLLFPYRYEWRWGLQGEKNNWYESVRLIRQESHGDWTPVLSKVFDNMLPEYVANHAGGVQ